MRLRREPDPHINYDVTASHGDPSPEFDWTVSRILRVAREQAGYSIDDVARVLRIRAGQIHAIEDGRFDELPATVYAIGFVRSYSELLDLDGDEVVRRFKDECAGISAKTVLVFPTPVPEGRMPSGAILMIAVLLAALSYGGWYYYSNQETQVVERSDFVPDRFIALSEQEPADTEATVRQSQPTYEPSAANAAEGQPDGTALSADTVSDPTPLSQARGDTLADAVGVPGFDEAPDTTLTVQTASTVSGAVDLAALPVAANAADGDLNGDLAAVLLPPVAPEDEGGRSFGAADGEIVLRATGESWVQVNDARGALVMTRVLRPGDTYVLPDTEGLRLITGNAGGLDILVDGQVTPSLGGTGVVVRDIVMDPQRLVNGTAASN